MNNTSDPKFFYLKKIPGFTLQVCYKEREPSGPGLMAINPLEEYAPLFFLQFGIVLAFSRIFLFLSTLSHVPRITANIFAGFLLGPSGLGGWYTFVKHVSSFSNMMSIETIASVAQVYYAFFMGLKMDFKPLKTCDNTRAKVVAVAGIISMLPIGCGLYFLLLSNMGRNSLPKDIVCTHMKSGFIWGMALSCSEFPEIADIVSDLKLLLTDNGQLALTSSLITDLASWIFFIVNIVETHANNIVAVASTIMFAPVSYFVLSPIAKWLINKLVTRDREVLEFQVVFLLHMVLAYGLIADQLSGYSMIGAFVLGAAIPKGVFSNTVQEKGLDFVSAILMPIYFFAIGSRITIQDFAQNISWVTVVIVILLAIMAKILCIFTVSYSVYHIPRMEALSLGLIMNTKGMVSLIILTSARDRQDLSSQSYGVIMVACWLMTLPVGPVLAAWGNNFTSRVHNHSQRKTMQGTRPDSPLRVLACVHTKADTSSIINLLIASSPSVKSPIQVVAVELIKMTTDLAASASSLIVRPSVKSRKRKIDDPTPQPEDTLDSFDDLNHAIFTEKMKVISDYNTMHKDIFNLANQRGVTLIVTTLCKQPTYDGLGAGTATARAANIVNREQAFRDEKKVVLEHLVNKTPCCLAIFVDRGFGQRQVKMPKYAMIYVGGADDREALSYAWRMSRNAEARLTVVRIVWRNPNDRFDEMDEEHIRLFSQQTRHMPWVRYVERMVRDEKETVSLLNSIGKRGFELYIIGRGHGRMMSLAQTEDPVLDEPALGPLGDTLADLNSASQTSILILQSQPVVHGHGDDSSRKSGRSSSSASSERHAVQVHSDPTHSRLESRSTASDVSWHTSKFFFSAEYL